MAHLGICQNFGLKLPLSRGHHPSAGVAVHIHKAQRTKTVEPSVGHPVDELRSGLGWRLLLLRHKSLFQCLHRLRAFTPRGTIFCQHHGEFGAYLLKQSTAGILGKFFEAGGVHVLVSLRCSGGTKAGDGPVGEYAVPRFQIVYLPTG